MNNPTVSDPALAGTGSAQYIANSAGVVTAQTKNNIWSLQLDREIIDILKADRFQDILRTELFMLCRQNDEIP